MYREKQTRYDGLSHEVWKRCFEFGEDLCLWFQMLSCDVAQFEGWIQVPIHYFNTTFLVPDMWLVLTPVFVVTFI